MGDYTIGTGNVSMHGGAGNDTLYGGQGNDTLVGGTGADTLTFSAGAVFSHLDLKSIYSIETLTRTSYGTLNGSSGNDAIDLSGITSISNVSGIYLNAGHDAFSGSSLGDSVEGGSGDDWIFGGDGNDTLNGDVGADTLSGGDGNDLLIGGDGADRLIGGDGNDSLNGGAGNDTILAISGGDNLLFGDDGDDILTTGGGNDIMHGGYDNDDLLSGYGDDVLYGDDGNDILAGGFGNDTLYGGTGNDTLNGDDSLIGGDGNDSLYGGVGDDTLIGGAGDDLFRVNLGTVDAGDSFQGGTGTDTFSMQNGLTVSSLILDTAASIEVFDNVYNFVLQGSAGNDTLDFSGVTSMNNVGAIHLNAGNDSFVGSVLSDVIYGDAGNDLFRVDEGTVGAGESYQGGTGTDTLYLNASTAFSSLILDAAASVEILDNSEGFGLNGTFGDDVFNLSGVGTMTDVSFIFLYGDNDSFVGSVLADSTKPVACLKGIPNSTSMSGKLGWLRRCTGGGGPASLSVQLSKTSGDQTRWSTTRAASAPCCTQASSSCDS